MGTLERRRERMRENDERVAMACQRVFAEHAADDEVRRARTADAAGVNDDVDQILANAEEVGHEVAIRAAASERVKLLCECGGDTCRAAFHVTGTEHREARGDPGAFLCDPLHERPDLEQRGSLGAVRDFVIVKSRPATGGKPAVETLKLHLDMLERENDGHTAQLNAALVRIAAAATSGALVLGLYTALRPKGAETLPIGWVIGALVPFLGLILTSLFGPRAIRSWIADQVDASRTTVADMAESSARRRAGRPDVAELVTAPGATYETFDRLDAIRESATANAEAFLPQRDWLSIEIRRQSRLHVTYEAVRKAESLEGATLAWLTLLVVYIVLVTFLA